jgi:hypothetical protein
LDDSPKPAATAIHNLTSILQDSGPDAASFSPGSLDYSVSGLSDTGHTSLTEKSNGSFQAIIWNELPVWDPVSHQPIANSSTSVTVNLGQNFGTVEVFDPLQSANAVQTLHNVSALNLDVSDHLLVVQASSANGGADPSSADPVQTFITAPGNDTFAFNTSTIPTDPSPVNIPPPTDFQSSAPEVPAAVAAVDVAVPDFVPPQPDLAAIQHHNCTLLA